MDMRQVDEFEYHRAKGKQVQDRPFSQIKSRCDILKKTLLTLEMNSNIESLIKLVKINWADAHPSDQPDKKISKAHIYPIRLKQNQQEDLPRYLDILQKHLEKACVEINQPQQKDKKKQKKEPKNIFDMKEDDVFVKRESGTNVRDITLNIYMKSLEDIDDNQEMRLEFKLHIYIIENVTDLSEQNMYVFSKGIVNREFIAFVPTFQTFEDDNYEGIDRLAYEKYQCGIYDPRKLFADYMYECMKDDVVRGYLPGQCIKLIQDMDYYHIGYWESCRRYDYCLFRTLQICNKERPLVDFAGDISKIQSIINSKLKFHCREYKTDVTRILKIILQDNTPYLISSKILSIEIAFLNSQEKITIDEDQLILKFRARLEQHYKKTQYYKHFTDEVKLKPTRGRGSHSERDRLKKLGLLGQVQTLSEKKKLEFQITKLIQDITQKIRSYVSNIKWSQIKFEQRIRPMIPFKIHKAMKEEKDMEDLVDAVTSYHSQPISSLLALYPESQIGYGLYLLKTAELSGLVTLSKRQINPLVYCNYFEKSTFGNH